MNGPATLPGAWRERAAMFREHGADAQAAVLERVASELEAALRAAEQEELTLAEAAAESGYSERRLRELAAAGELENVGRKGRPRFRRGDLPRKRSGRSAAGGYDPSADARSLVARLK